MKQNNNLSSRQDFWTQIISPNRLFEKNSNPDRHDKRSVFDMDHDRIVYSHYFRRMHDKTQVFPYAPLSSMSQARSRLSHSIEVSCVGRSLGFLAGKYLQEKGIHVIPYDLGMITATACLAHDIGNPPFGHTGEDAIKEWAINNLKQLTDPWELNDIINFEGNAQGFRILTRLEAWQRYGGLRTTTTTLAAFSKYPCSSPDSNEKSNHVSEKKFGYFKEDADSFIEVFSDLGIAPKQNKPHAYPRHPLSFLTEAADDICYAIVDMEDAYHLGITSFEIVRDLLRPIAEMDSGFEDDESYENEIRLARYRSAAISTLVKETIDIFINSIDQIECFTFEKSLITQIPNNHLYSDIKKYSFDYIYSAPKVMEIESAGFKAITGLLDIFVPSVLSEQPSRQQIMNRNIIPHSHLKRREKHVEPNHIDELIANLSPYERILSITDYISGMTDRYIIELYQRLSGIKLPEY
jgi:dGTPase